jgi:two-component system, chemotaxis family, CheB/CheR fusion protein
MPDEQDDPAFEALIEYVKDARAFDFSGYKRPSLRRRFEKRLQAVGAESFEDYADYLEANPDEFFELFDTLLINVTSFFRDAPSWEFLASDVIPRVAAHEGTIRVWTPGCASGEEPYTVAMLLAEAMGAEEFAERTKIYATDLDDDALRGGRHAVYSEKQVAPVGSDLLERYFVRNGEGFQFRPDLRRTVVFGRHDLVRDPPISHVGLLVCRNTLMYFNAETQRRILSNFHFALRTDGFLFLGKSEVMLTRTRLFMPFDLRRRVFVKAGEDANGDMLRTLRVDGLVTERPDRGVDEAAFETAPSAQLVLERSGTLVRANAHARRLFGLTTRDRERPLGELDLPHSLELASRLDEAFTERRPIVMRDLVWTRGEEPSAYDVQIVPLLTAGGEVVGASITFTDVLRYKTLEASLETAHREIETAYEELQSTNEELETTNEELQSTNEELETTNEELQSTNEELETTNEELHSTNEELETMNEELQSTNEELETMNDELARRTDELNDSNAFLEAVLGSLSSGVVVVDTELRVLAWNRGATELWGIQPPQTPGTHLLNLDIALPVVELRQPLRKVLRAEAPSVDVTLAARNRRGREILCRVTCTPLAGPNASPRGAILLMEEVPAGDAG